jgi:hypothetical protein
MAPHRGGDEWIVHRADIHQHGRRTFPRGGRLPVKPHHGDAEGPFGGRPGQMFSWSRCRGKEAGHDHHEEESITLTSHKATAFPEYWPSYTLEPRAISVPEPPQCLQGYIHGAIEVIMSWSVESGFQHLCVYFARLLPDRVDECMMAGERGSAAVLRQQFLVHSKRFGVSIAPKTGGNVCNG